MAVLKKIIGFINWTFLTIGILSLTLSFMICYAYRQQYEKAHTETTNTLKLNAEIKEERDKREHLIHTVVKGTELTGEEVRKFRAQFINEFNIEIQTTSWEKTDKINTQGTYVVIDKVFEEDSYKYVIKEIVKKEESSIVTNSAIDTEASN